MRNIWSFFPALPMQPSTWPLLPGTQRGAAAGPGGAAPATPPFGGAPTWIAPPSTHPGSPDWDTLVHRIADPESIERLAEARRSYDFILWAFGPLNRDPAQPTRDLAARPGSSPRDYATPVAPVPAADRPLPGDLPSAMDNSGSRSAPAAAPSGSPVQPTGDLAPDVGPSTNTPAIPSAAPAVAPSPQQQQAGMQPRPAAQAHSKYWHATRGRDRGPAPFDREEALARTANTRRLASEGWEAGVGGPPIIQHGFVGPDTKFSDLPDWAQQDARFLWNVATVPGSALDTTLRTARGAYLAAIGAVAGALGDAGLESHPDDLARALPEYMNVLGAATMQPELTFLPRFPVSPVTRFATKYPGEAVPGLVEPNLFKRSGTLLDEPRPAAPLGPQSSRTTAFETSPQPDAPFPQYATEHPPKGAPTLVRKSDETPIEAVSGSDARRIAFETTPKPDAPFPQYATEYPPVGRPTLVRKSDGRPIEGVSDSDAQRMVDARQAYWKKTLPPETEAFRKRRLAEMKDMEQNGYEPYFDPGQRFHVDPANYPTNIDTTRDAVPKTPNTRQKYTTMIDTPQVRARLQAAFQDGFAKVDSDNWPAFGQVEDLFIRELGAEKGRVELKRLVDGIAATTGGATPRSNLLMAQYGRFLDVNGSPLPPSHQFPYPVGGQFAGPNMEMFERTVRNPEWTGFGAKNPKRHDFAYDFLGHPNMFVVDKKVIGDMLPGHNAPPGKSYGIAAGVGHDVAAQNGLTPSEFRSVLWAGLNSHYKGSVIKEINDRIELTHRLTGMPRREIARRGLVLGQIPLYGLGGAAIGVPGLLPSSEDHGP